MALKFSDQLFLSLHSFYLGDSGFVKIIGDYLPKGSHGIINDLGIALSQTVPLNQYVSAGTLTIVGVITGLDGSGFQVYHLLVPLPIFWNSTWPWNSYINSTRANCSYMDRGRDVNSLGTYSCCCNLQGRSI